MGSIELSGMIGWERVWWKIGSRTRCDAAEMCWCLVCWRQTPLNAAAVFAPQRENGEMVVVDMQVDGVLGYAISRAVFGRLVVGGWWWTTGKGRLGTDLIAWLCEVHPPIRPSPSPPPCKSNKGQPKQTDKMASQLLPLGKRNICFTFRRVDKRTRVY
jgi:hypothetical protein